MPRWRSSASPRPRERDAGEAVADHGRTGVNRCPGPGAQNGAAWCSPHTGRAGHGDAGLRRLADCDRVEEGAPRAQAVRRAPRAWGWVRAHTALAPTAGATVPGAHLAASRCPASLGPGTRQPRPPGRAVLNSGEALRRRAGDDAAVARQPSAGVRVIDVQPRDNRRGRRPLHAGFPSRARFPSRRQSPGPVVQPRSSAYRERCALKPCEPYPPKRQYPKYVVGNGINWTLPIARPVERYGVRTGPGLRHH